MAFPSHLTARQSLLSFQWNGTKQTQGPCISYEFWVLITKMVLLPVYPLVSPGLPCLPWAPFPSPGTLPSSVRLSYALSSASPKELCFLRGPNLIFQLYSALRSASASNTAKGQQIVPGILKLHWNRPCHHQFTIKTKNCFCICIALGIRPRPLRI